MANVRNGSFVYLCTLALMIGCKAPTHAELQDDIGTSGEEELTLAVNAQPPAVLQSFFESMRTGREVPDYSLKTLIPQALDGSHVTETFTMTTQSYQGDSYEGNSYEHDDYIGLALPDDALVVFAKKFGQGAAEKHWKPLAIVPASIRPDLSEVERMREYLNTKKYDAISNAQYSNTVEQLDFFAHFIPGYAGAERIFYADGNGWERTIGSAQFVGDVATLGLGTKIRIVQQSSAAAVVLSTTARVADASAQTYNGTAGVGTAVDAFLATAEGALSLVTLVKLRIPAVSNAMVGNIDEARAIAPSLSRDADDVLANGLSKAEMDRFVVRRGDDLEDALSSWDQLCATGFSLGGGRERKCQIVKNFLNGIVPANSANSAIGLVRVNPSYKAQMMKAELALLESFEAAARKGTVAPEASIGIVSGKDGGYTHKLKILGSGGNKRFYGNLDEDEGILTLEKMKDGESHN